MFSKLFSVTIDVDAWLREHERLLQKEVDDKARELQRLQRLEKKRKLLENGGEATEKKKKQKLTEEGSEAAERKRKRRSKPSQSSSLILMEGECQHSMAAVPDLSNNGNHEKSKESRATKKLKQKPRFPCALCPDTSEENMLRIIESDPAPQSISPATETTNVVGDAVDLVVGLLGEDAQVVQGHIENGGFQNNSTTSAQPTTKSSSRPRPTKWAHRICCIFTPSTWIDTLPTGEEVVRGFELIEKTRWALKCQICSEKMGTKVQCTKSAKCVKACHVTCALNTGFFFVDAQVSHGEQTYSLLYPANGPPEGLEISQDPTIVVLCKQHNPSYQKSEAERKARELSEKIGCFESNQEIKVRTSKGVFQVRFVSREEERKSLKVVFEDGNLSEVSYNKVYFGPSVPAPASQSKSLNKPKDKPGRVIFSFPPSPSLSPSLSLCKRCYSSHWHFYLYIDNYHNYYFN
ncbi:hypothetical protein BY996DRAFT_3937631 [Phakopsora pachyrhizi]|nr:hypothetical protein BY996DRAFT_3937631 [Phakopsora pachyrhizi]